MNETQDRLISINAMIQTLQTQLLTCLVRVNVSSNMKLEMINKIDWLRKEIENI